MEIFSYPARRCHKANAYQIRPAWEVKPRQPVCVCVLKKRNAAAVGPWSFLVANLEQHDSHLHAGRQTNVFDDPKTKTFAAYKLTYAEFEALAEKNGAQAVMLLGLVLPSSFSKRFRSCCTKILNMFCWKCSRKKTCFVFRQKLKDTFEKNN